MYLFVCEGTSPGGGGAEKRGGAVGAERGRQAGPPALDDDEPRNRLREFAIWYPLGRLSDWFFSPRFREFHAVQFRVVDDRGQQLERHPERDLGAEGPAGRDRPGAAEDQQHPQVRLQTCAKHSNS